mmetsp:Transcript_50955/g.75596  ORF Transcript_50955/g.75596 Transcript_50955/m.75596 type:complete len:205 (-) Transcript_50955:184-798(-)
MLPRRLRRILRCFWICAAWTLLRRDRGRVRLEVARIFQRRIRVVPQIQFHKVHPIPSPKSIPIPVLRCTSLQSPTLSRRFHHPPRRQFVSLNARYSKPAISYQEGSLRSLQWAVAAPLLHLHPRTLVSMHKRTDRWIRSSLLESGEDVSLPRILILAQGRCYPNKRCCPVHHVWKEASEGFPIETHPALNCYSEYPPKKMMMRR